MSLTLSQLATRVLRNCEIPEDSTTPSVQALADAKQYINERLIDIHSRRNWPEYFMLGSYAVPASTQQIALSSITPDSGFNTAGSGRDDEFDLVVAMRNSSKSIFAEDPGVIAVLKADLWAETSTPSYLVNRGQSGIFLLGQFTASTTLNFFGKAKAQDLTDAETWVMGNAGDKALILGASADMLKWFASDDNRAMLVYQEYEAEIAKMILKVDEQSMNIKRIVPRNPWTRQFGQFRDTTVTGIGSRNYVY